MKTGTRDNTVKRIGMIVEDKLKIQGRLMDTKVKMKNYARSPKIGSFMHVLIEMRRNWILPIFWRCDFG